MHTLSLEKSYTVKLRDDFFLSKISEERELMVWFEVLIV